MHRVVVYIRVGARGPLRLTSEPVETEHEANVLLESLVQLPGATGGDVETKVEGIGWVICTAEEAVMMAESAQICARRREE